MLLAAASIFNSNFSLYWFYASKRLPGERATSFVSCHHVRSFLSFVCLGKKRMRWWDAGRSGCRRESLTHTQFEEMERIVIIKKLSPHTYTKKRKIYLSNYRPEHMNESSFYSPSFFQALFSLSLCWVLCDKTESPCGLLFTSIFEGR